MTFRNLLGGGGAGIGGGADQIGRGLIRMGVDTSGMRGQARKGFNDLNDEAKQGAQRAQQTTSKFWGAALGVVKAGAIAAGAATVSALGMAAAAAVTYESAFAGVIKTVDASPAVLDRLRGKFREMAKEIPISAVEFARLGEAAGALGVAVEDIEEFARVTALIGVTTDVSADQAAVSLGQLSNVLGLTSADYEKFGSTLVDLGNKGASTESQILEIASRSGAVGKNIGLSTPAILAFASAVANLGIEVEAGGSSLQFLYSKLSGILADEDKLARLGEVAGMTGEKMRVAFEEDAQGAIVAFLSGLGELTSTEQAVALDDLGLAGVRTSRAYIGMANSMEQNLLPAFDNANAAWEENNALQTEAEKRFATTESQMKLLQNRVGDLFIELGYRLLPAINQFVTFLAEGIPAAAEKIAEVWNTTLGPAVAGMWQGFSDLGAAVLNLFNFGDEAAEAGGVLESAFGGVVTVVAEIAEWMGKITGGLATLLESDIGGWAARLLIGFGLLRVAVDGVVRGTRFLSGLGRGTLSFLSGGLLGGKGGGSGAAAADAAGDAGADGLQVAARELKAAAASLKGAAGALSAGGLGGVGGGVGPAAGGAVPGGVPPVARAATSRLSTAALQGSVLAGRTIANETAAAMARGAAQGSILTRAGGAVTGTVGRLTSTGADIARGTASAMASGASQAGRGFMAGGRSLMGLAGGALGLASKALWPALIGSLVLDIAAQPIGGLVSSALGKVNLGAEIATDGIISGIGTWLESIREGVEVELIAGLNAEVITASGVTITRTEAAKMGLTRTTMEEMFADNVTVEGTLETIHAAHVNVGNALQPIVVDAPELVLPTPTPDSGGIVWSEERAAQVQSMTETRAAWEDQMRVAADTLGIDLAALYSDAMGVAGSSTIYDPAALAYITRTMRATAREKWKTDFGAFRTSVEDQLKAAFDLSDQELAFLSDAEIEYLAVAMERNANGEYTSEIQSLLNRVATTLAGNPLILEPPPVDPTNPELGIAGRSEIVSGGGANNTGTVPTGISDQIAATKRLIETELDWATLLLTDVGQQNIVRGAGIQIATYGAAIKAATEDESLRQGIIDELGVGTWEEVLAEQQSWFNDTGQTRAMTLAQSYSDLLTTAGKNGVDLSKTSWANDMRALLMDALDSGRLTPEAEAEIRSLLTTGLTNATQSDEVNESSDAGGRRVIAGMNQGILNAEPELNERVRTAIENAIKPGLSDEMKAILSGRGREIVNQVAAGVSGAEQVLEDAMEYALKRGLGPPLPSSPVKSGPLKHPFLPNAGREIMRQIGMGILAEPLPTPTFAGMDIPGLPGSAAGSALRGNKVTGGGAGTSQSVKIDTVYLNNAQDEQGIMNRMRFLMAD